VGCGRLLFPLLKFALSLITDANQLRLDTMREQRCPIGEPNRRAALASVFPVALLSLQSCLLYCSASTKHHAQHRDHYHPNRPHSVATLVHPLAVVRDSSITVMWVRIQIVQPKRLHTELPATA
jgi:hypothetical protein